MEKYHTLTFFVKFSKEKDINFLNDVYELNISVLNLEERLPNESQDSLTYIYTSGLSSYRVKWITKDKHLKFIGEQANKTKYGDITRDVYKKYFIKKLFEEIRKTNFVSKLKNIAIEESKKRLKLLSELEVEVIING